MLSFHPQHNGSQWPWFSLLVLALWAFCSNPVRCHLLLDCTVTILHATDRHGGGHAQDEMNTVFTVFAFQTSHMTWGKRSWGDVVRTMTSAVHQTLENNAAPHLAVCGARWAHHFMEKPSLLHRSNYAATSVWKTLDTYNPPCVFAGPERLPPGSGVSYEGEFEILAAPWNKYYKFQPYVAGSVFQSWVLMSVARQWPIQKIWQVLKWRPEIQQLPLIQRRQSHQWLPNHEQSWWPSRLAGMPLHSIALFSFGICIECLEFPKNRKFATTLVTGPCVGARILNFFALDFKLVLKPEV
jgi:hypothetical protein